MSNRLKTLGEKNVTVLPPDIELMRVMLENGEIDNEENLVNNTIVLENGIVVTFDDDGSLLSLDTE